VWGNGDVALLETLADKRGLGSMALLLLLRLLATTVCVGTGTIGGVFTPTLFAGASFGLIAGQLLHVPQPVLIAVAGLSAFLAAATHAPVMAGFMAVELTGRYELLPLLLPLNFGASFVAKHLSTQSLYATSAQPSVSGCRAPDRQASGSHEAQLAEPLETLRTSEEIEPLV
jgi:CIC family chloride channel protein